MSPCMACRPNLFVMRLESGIRYCRSSLTLYLTSSLTPALMLTFTCAAGCATFTFMEIGIQGEKGHMELGRSVSFIHTPGAIATLCYCSDKPP